ncbi:uncharacterized protein LOC121427749 [Lytechinus variegatus]|uniref:uncharacterized protein LOC121427749 n=1 Tax=Lytechinus variegatus TaxID=7654 RepID=UPI001BB21FE0|nr:uncharacterized protein LOC121427749 [Lytechinus variegatus]XP_041480229.1 uncharacterized protein LOC121427749 [Lytechinus variegatus]
MEHQPDQKMVNTTEDTNIPNVDHIAAGLSLAVLVVMGIVGNLILLLSVGSAMRTVRHRWNRLVHDLIFMYGCLEMLFFLIPCLLSTIAYLSSWNVDTHQSVCDFFGWIVMSLKFGSLWMLTSLAIERYFVICKQEGTSNRFAWTMRFVTFGGILIVTVYAAVPLMVKIGMVASEAVPNAVCHLDFTPVSRGSQAFAISTIVLTYVMFQITLFCHVSILCVPSRDVREKKAPIQEGATLHHMEHSLVYGFTPLSIWVWLCTAPLWITLILTQTGSEISTGWEFGVLRTLTVSSALSPYILLLSSAYYRSSFCHFVCCRDAQRKQATQEEQYNDVPNDVRCEDCQARIIRSENGQRVNNMTPFVDLGIPRTRDRSEQYIISASQQRPVDEAATPNGRLNVIKAEVESHTQPTLDDAHPPTSSPGILPTDSKIYLLSAGANGELVCRRSFDGGSLRDDNESISPRGDRGSSSSQGSSPRDGYPDDEDDDDPSDDDQAGGYLITLPVNMPGQGSNETVERIFYIQEPPQKFVESSVVGEDGAAVKNYGTENDIDRDGDAVFHGKGPLRPNLAHVTRPNLAGLVMDSMESGSDGDMEDEELSRFEAEIRGRIMGRSNRRKLLRSSEPQSLGTKTDSRRERLIGKESHDDLSIGDSDISLSRDGVREQDIRIHGPSASDPHLLTLAFQQAMLSHSQRHDNERQTLQSDEMVDTKSPSRLIPVINITPAEGIGDLDDVQPIFSQRSNRIDYRFLAPIAEEAGLDCSRSSHNLPSMLNTKHEKVHRMPKTNAQIMSNWKLQEDVRRSASSTHSVIQRQNAEEMFHEDDTESLEESDSNEQQDFCASGVNSLDNGLNSVSKVYVADEDDSSENITPRTLEKVGDVVERSADGKQKTADPLLETPEWLNVEQAMQGHINQGFIDTEDILSSNNGRDNNHLPLTANDNASQIGVEENAEKNSEENLDCLDTQSEGAGSIPVKSIDTLGNGHIEIRTSKKTLPLKRQDRLTESENDVNLSGVLRASPNNLQIQLKDVISEVNDNFTMSKHSSLGTANGVEESVEYNSNEEPRQTYSTKNEIGLHKNGEPKELSTAVSLGKGLPKSTLVGVNSYPLTGMRGFSIDGNLYVIYPKKWARTTSKPTRDDDFLERSDIGLTRSSPMDEKSESGISLSTHKKVDFMDIETKRNQPRVQVAMV